MRYGILFVLAALLVVPAGSQTLWQPQASGITSYGYFLCVKAVNDSVVWAAADSLVIRTRNGGAAWQVCSVPKGGFMVWSIDAVDSITAWVAVTGVSAVDFRIMKTTNGGATWSEQYQNANTFGNAIQFFDANNGVAYADPDPNYFVVLTTTNGGTNWVRVDSVNIPTIQPNEFGVSNSMEVLGNHVWFATAGSRPFYPRVFHSTDRGNTWTSSAPLTGLQDDWIIDFSFKDTLHGVLTTTVGVVMAKTSDGGATWASMSGPLTTDPCGVAYVPTSNAIIVAGARFNGGYVCKTFDEGATWVETPLPDNTPGLGLVAFSSIYNGWVFGYGGTILKWVGMGPLVNIYVDAAADSTSADGSGLHPYKKIDQACQWAQSGGTISVMPGTYGNVNINAPRPTHLTIQSTDGAKVTTIDMKQQVNVYGIAFRASAGWVIDGFTFKDLQLKGGAGYGSGVYFDSRNVDTSALSIVRNCVFLGDPTPGARSRGVWVQKFTKVLIHHNYFIGVNNNGVISYGHVDAFNNTFVHTKGGTENPVAAYWQAGDGGSNGVARLKNNIFYDDTVGIGRGGDCFAYSSFNLYYLNYRDTISVTADSGNNVMADPMFFAPGSGDYRPAVGSPAIDHGTPVGLPYVGAAPDIGAYEGTGVTHVDEETAPMTYALRQNYPNPFNPRTTIMYELPRASHVTLTVYDILGREVTTLVNAVEEPGYKSLEWNAGRIASGLYFYRLQARPLLRGQAGDFVQTCRMLLIK
jgi:photosystem II stability/assembly factor-like uncharacterized protein